MQSEPSQSHRVSEGMLATRNPTTVIPVPQAREVLVEGSMKR
jgi:hypothetical protein